MTATSDIHHLNEQVLLTARDSAKTDRAEACLKFGLTEQECDVLASLSLSEVRQAARTGTFLFHAKFDAKLLQALAAARSDQTRTVLAMVSNHGTA